MMEKIARFMYGRCGMDKMNKELLVAAMVLAVLEWVFILTGLEWLTAVCFALSFLALVILMIRALSRNRIRRNAELQTYLKMTAAPRRGVSLAVLRFRNRKLYRFVRCPACKTVHRVPKGKGTIRIRCSKCGKQFEKKV